MAGSLVVDSIDQILEKSPMELRFEHRKSRNSLRSSRPDISSILANFIDFWNLLGTGKLPQMMPIDFIEDFSRLSRIERSLQRGYEKSAQEGK